MNKFQIMDIAAGKKPADLVFKNARVVDVLAGRIIEGDVAVADGVIAGIGSYSGVIEVDCTDKYLSPGFINCHCHIESVMITPDGYAVEEIKCGTTTIITDPHEIANVAGTEGLDYMLSYWDKLPVDYYMQLPSCVPATPMENAGAVLLAQDLAPYKSSSTVLGLGEVMNVPGVLAQDSEVHAKLELFEGGIVDGHSPGLTGHGLSSYVLSGITTDHESTTFQEAVEKVSNGIAVLVREGSASKNLHNILKPFIQQGLSTHRLAFCTDDKHLADITEEGTISHCIRLATKLGMPPIQAIQMATINGANIYGLSGKGAIAPGYAADLVVLGSLVGLEVLQVYKDGVQVCENGSYIGEPLHPEPCTEGISHSVRLPALSVDSFALSSRAVHPVINMIAGEILTKREDIPAAQALQELREGTICKIASIERHGGSGGIGVGLLRGYGIRNGAIAGTIAHDSHNLLVAGDNDSDMLLAAERAAELQGGYVLVQHGCVVQELPLPIAGLMSDLPASALSEAVEAMVHSIRKAGVGKDIDPLTTLSFMALPVIPEIRITDRGMMDTCKGELI
ncbi:MAG: adenine deaminase [Angelakisella sp.]